MKKNTMMAMLVLLFALLALNGTAHAAQGEDALAEGLAWYYGTETGTADFDKAEAAFQTAADAGVADAWYYLGRVAYQRSDFDAAIAYFEKGAEQGSELARFNLGILYVNNEGLDLNLDADYAKAQALFEQAVENGCVEANCGLGDLYQSGYGVEADGASALAYFLLAAESDDPEWAPYAWLSIYEVYTAAPDLDMDSEEAKAWGEKGLEGKMLLADAGHPKAEFSLGYLYYAGLDVEQDYGAAMSWFLKAAEIGDARSMRFIAYMYDKGLGVEEDQEKSTEWYLKAAEAGYTSAMSTVGKRYELGKGVEQNIEAAIEWYRKAAEAGNEKAAERLAELTGK